MGLELFLGNPEKYIRINDLKEVTDPMILIKNTPTSGGLLSYEIFGVSVSDRQDRLAFIDLKSHYMKPAAVKKLKTYDKRLYNILFSIDKYKLLSDGELEKDLEGLTGPEYLYSIWDDVNKKSKDTVLTKEIEEYFKSNKKDEIFLTKWIIIPAFYRDVNFQNEGKISVGVINEIYTQILAYSQNMLSYTDAFTYLKFNTQSRVQQLLVDCYDMLYLKTVKGQPSKYGLLRKSYLGKLIDYASRLVISAPNLDSDSVESMQIKFGYAGIPLSYICSKLFPFMVYELKNYFDREFTRGGKYPVVLDGEASYVTVEDSYDEEFISDQITKFINSPSSRFNKVPIPRNSSGKELYMRFYGRFKKDQSMIKRPATWTDLLFVIAMRVVKDKHVDITRYPLEDAHGQSVFKITVLTTLNTMPILIGDHLYDNYPIIEGDPANAFIDTAQFSNTMLDRFGGDYDGDMTSNKVEYSVEANFASDKFIKSKGYILALNGTNMATMTKEFILTSYVLTKDDREIGPLPEANSTKPLYQI